MKKEFFNKVLIFLAIIFLVLQIVYSQIKLRTGVYNRQVRIAEYIVIAFLMITTLLYAREENKEFFKKLLLIYVALGILVILFLLRGVI